MKHPFEGDLSARDVFYWVLGVSVLEWIGDKSFGSPMSRDGLLLLAGGLAAYAVIDHLHAIRRSLEDRRQ